MKLVSGTINGTGADVYVCCGFVPDKVTFRNSEATNTFWIEWSKNFRSAEQADGVLFGTAAGITGTVLTPGIGIAPYEGGEAMTSTNQTSVAYGEGVYLHFDPIKDYRASDILAGSAAIDRWTLGSSGNRTGNFNNDVVGGFIGEGSRIMIDGKWYFICALTAGQGVAANEVTLSRAPASGLVQAISGMYDMVPIPLGSTSEAGFVVKNATVNVNDNICYFEAVTYEN